MHVGHASVGGLKILLVNGLGSRQVLLAASTLQGLAGRKDKKARELLETRQLVGGMCCSPSLPQCTLVLVQGYQIPMCHVYLPSNKYPTPYHD
jgi:hypothetical protein